MGSDAASSHEVHMHTKLTQHKQLSDDSDEANI
jgi:hypothetical protein